ncbi:MAG TPA: MmcQ/YjbR family DNA-binding protein [Terriglobales bacterium]|nr:MmcQ/YjbR family DNA-binding protein [Terriglobales bacterium]
MHIDQLRKFCLSFPGVTEQIQWENDLLFKVGGKMFAVTPLEPARVWLSLKATPENFAELTERPGIIPAPYLARAKWIAVETREALGIAELEQLLRESYEMVRAKLPRKVQDGLAKTGAPGPVPKRKAHPAKTRTRKSKQPRKRKT